MYTLNLFLLLIKAPPLYTTLHLPLKYPNSLNRHTVTKTHTDGYTSPLQIIMYFLIRLERFEDFLTEEWLVFLFASLVITFLGVLLTCYSLIEQPLVSWERRHANIEVMSSSWPRSTAKVLMQWNASLWERAGAPGKCSNCREWKGCWRGAWLLGQHSNL